MRPLRLRRAVVAAAVCAIAAGGCGRDSPDLNPSGPSPIPRSGAVVLVGAGDIAECGVAGATETAYLLDQIEGTVFTVGDNAYYQGTRDDFERCYEPTWGRHKARTRPIPGNHEYETPGAAGYFAYFGAAAAPSAPGYYSYDLGAWHIVALNSNIPIDAGSAQLAWLRGDLASHPAACTLAYVHHPLFSSGRNGPSLQIRPLWDVLHAAGVEVVVSGHDHNYERFAPQDPNGRAEPSRGVRQFVVGTGGAHLYPVPVSRSNSEAIASVWGVLKLTLRATDYHWEFVPVAGQVYRDAGTGVCH